MLMDTNQVPTACLHLHSYWTGCPRSGQIILQGLGILTSVGEFCFFDLKRQVYELQKISRMPCSLIYTGMARGRQGARDVPSYRQYVRAKKETNLHLFLLLFVYSSILVHFRLEIRTSRSHFQNIHYFSIHAYTVLCL